MAAVTAADTHRAIDAVWRIESARLIAGLARIVGDIGLAEDLAQDALRRARAVAESECRTTGRLAMATAKNRAPTGCAEKSRRSQARGAGREIEACQETAVPDLDAAIDDHVGDDLLGLMFTACHPVLSTDARVALTLRLIGGLETSEIARAFLVPEATVAQESGQEDPARARVPFEVPRGTAARLLGARVPTSCSTRATRRPPATTGWPALCEDALRLAGSWPGSLRRSRSPRPRRADGDPGVAPARAPARRRAAAALDRPRRPASHSPRPPRSAGRGAWRRARPVRAQAAIAACQRARGPRPRRPGAHRGSLGRRSPRSRRLPSWT